MSKKGEGKGKKRKKNYYVQFQKKQRTNTLEPGTRGFLVTCNNDERRCIREAYNLLNEFADTSEHENKKMEVVESEERSVEEELQEELETLREGSPSQGGRTFQQVYTGIQSCLFIQSKVDPCPVLLRILDSIQTTGKQKTIATQKVFPVLATCKAHLDSLRKTFKDVIDHILLQKDFYLTDKKLQYAVLFRARHNNSINKDEVVTTVIDMVRSEGIAWEPEPRTPDCAVSFDILNTVCCISILPHYEKFKRYNLIELAKRKEEADDNGKCESTDIDSRQVVEEADEGKGEEQHSCKITGAAEGSTNDDQNLKRQVGDTEETEASPKGGELVSELELDRDRE